MTAVMGDENHRRLDALFRSDPFASGLGGELIGWSGGEARLRWTPGPEHGNFLGLVHGGALFSLADAALAVASNSWGRICVALSVEAQFLAASSPGRPVVAVARERSRTRRTAAYGIDVTAEDDPEALVAAFQGLTYRTDGWHLGTDAWSEEWRAAH